MIARVVRSSRQAHRGISLISTMIGLLIGMLSVVAMTGIYLAQSAQTEKTKTATALDGQAALGIVVAQLELQRAGFGVGASLDSCLGAADPGPSGTANTDFVLLDNASFEAGRFSAGTAVTVPPPAGTENDEPGLAVTGNAVVWRWVDDSGASQCGALVGDNDQLYLLSDVSCTDATGWSALSWSSTEINEVMAADAPSFSAYRSAASCAPFGRIPQSSGLYVGIQVGQSVAGMNSTSTICIPNICR